MNRGWSALVIALFGLSITASRADASVLVSVGTQLVFENASDGRTLEGRQPFALRGGYRFELGDLYLEYTRFSVSDGSEMVAVERTHHEWQLWGRRVLVPQWKLKPYLAAGLGLQYDNVETTLSGATTKTSGDPRFLSSVAAGLTAVVWERLEMQMEAMLSGSENFSPNPRAGFGIYVGWSF